LRVWGAGCRVQSLEFRVSGFGFEFWIQGLGFGVED
jgi:hypothetical protein